MLSGWGDWGLLRLMSLVLSGDGFTAGCLRDSFAFLVHTSHDHRTKLRMPKFRTGWEEFQNLALPLS